MEISFEKSTFKHRLKSMLGVDFRRMFTSSLFYIFIGISLLMPILILVMTTKLGGETSVNIETNNEGFKNVWEIIGSKSGSSMNMNLTGMCNMNMMFFALAIFTSIFISNDFKSGYSKNLFTIRSKRDDYVISKTISCFVAGISMLIAFFIGAMLGGVFGGVSFELDEITSFNIIMCLLSKCVLALLFVSIFTFVSVLGKDKLWFSIILSLGIGMLLFMMISQISPLDSNFNNFILSCIGSIIFASVMSVGSYFILKKISII